MKCPNCGANAAGKFCAECGTPLQGAVCAVCKTPLLPGAKFCSSCGARTGATRGAAAPRSWGQWVAGGLGVFALFVIALWLVTREAAPAPDQPTGAPMSQSGSGTPPPLSGSMRENADRLFNRVMQTREQGDTAGAKGFLPMAIDAYQSAGELDADGFYHLSILQSLAGSTDEAMQSAKRILADHPTHLLGLHAAATAARTASDRAEARNYYQQLLTNFAAEKTKQIPEYLDHSALLSGLEAEAREYLR